MYALGFDGIQYPVSLVILVGCFIRIPTEQLGMLYGIDFWKVFGIFPVSLVTTLCHLIFIVVHKTSIFSYISQKNDF